MFMTSFIKIVHKAVVDNWWGHSHSGEPTDFQGYASSHLLYNMESFEWESVLLNYPFKVRGD